MEHTIDVFGEEMLLWIGLLRQSPRRPPPQHVHQQANVLLDELKRSKAALDLPVQSVDDGMFAIATLLDEVAMSLPDLRPLWLTTPLQSTRWMTNNGGVELFDRLTRVQHGPKTILATYAAVLGMGFMGRFALPGADRYALAQLRRQLALQIGSTPDHAWQAGMPKAGSVTGHDWQAGVLKAARPDTGPSSLVPKEPLHRSIWFGRTLAITTLLAGIVAISSWANPVPGDLRRSDRCTSRGLRMVRSDRRTLRRSAPIGSRPRQYSSSWARP